MATSKNTKNLFRAIGIVDTLFTLACAEKLEDVGGERISSVLDALMDMLMQTKELVDGGAA